MLSVVAQYVARKFIADFLTGRSFLILFVNGQKQRTKSWQRDGNNLSLTET